MPHRARTARRGLVALPFLLVGMLAPGTALADGLGGLGALRALAYAAIFFVAMVFIGIWLLAKAIRYARRQGRAAGTIVDHRIDTGAETPPGGGPAPDTWTDTTTTTPQPYWLFDPDFPIGLRVLRVVQYGLAFPYACSGFLRLLMPAAYHNDHVAEWVQQWIYFSFSFALLAVLSANAYRDQGRAAGWKLGMALAWLCMANNTIGWLWHGLYDGFDPITMTFGVVLFLALQFRYRPWFGTERMTPWLQTAVRRAGIFAGGIAALLVSLMTLSLILTGPLALDHEDARMHVKAVREALKDHYAEHGAWPASLDELPDDVDLTYRWKRVDYDPAEPSVSLEVRIPLNPPPLSWRLTFGRAGFVPHVSRIGGSFRPRDDTAAND